MMARSSTRMKRCLANDIIINVEIDSMSTVCILFSKSRRKEDGLTEKHSRNKLLVMPYPRRVCGINDSGSPRFPLGDPEKK